MAASAVGVDRPPTSTASAKSRRPTSPTASARPTVKGVSEITAAIMNTTDSACRSLLGMEIAREFYSVPHRFVLGVNEGHFIERAGQREVGP
jgi:hypothetical protein